jgi:hypothetical protein
LSILRLAPAILLGMAVVSVRADQRPPAPAPASSDLRVVETVLERSDGTRQVERRAVDPDRRETLRLEADGRVTPIAQPSRSLRRVLIQLRDRPLLDAVAPGAIERVRTARNQLRLEVAELSTRLAIASDTAITREYELLFNGVAADVHADAVAQIAALPSVAAVYEDAQVRAALADSVPLIGAPAVWNTHGATGSNVRVAVIDTGIDYTHPDLGGCFGAGCRVAGGFDFANNDADPFDDNGHGTHVAGIIGASGSIKGVAPAVTLLAYKVLNSSGSGQTSDIIAALERAVRDGAKVANLSLGGSGTPNDPLSTAVDNATAAGVLSVVAAGNVGPGYQTIGSPGAARTALTVGASTKSGQMADFSSRGYVPDGNRLVMKPEIVAPGVDIRSTVPLQGSLSDPTRYAAFSGTSMAAPHVAGAAALLFQWNPSHSVEDVKRRLVESSVSLGYNAFTEGAGRVDVLASVRLPVIVSAHHLDFGIFDSPGVIQKQQAFSIRNPTATAQTVAVSAAPGLPPGAVVEITPADATLSPGESVSIMVTLRVDGTAVPDLSSDPFSYQTTVRVTAGAHTASVPLYFFKGLTTLDLSFDTTPEDVHLVSQDLGMSRTLSPISGTTTTAFVARGTWDVIVSFGGDPMSIVVREGQPLQQATSLSIQSSEATRSITARPMDDTGVAFVPTQQYGKFLIALKRGAENVVEFGLISDTRPGGIRLSPVSSRYVVAMTEGFWHATSSRFFNYTWAGAGLPGSVSLPITGAPFRRLVQKADVVDGASFTSVTSMVGLAARFGWGGFGTAQGTGRPAGADVTMVFQPDAASNLPVAFQRNESLFAWDASFATIELASGPQMRYRSGRIELYRDPLLDLLPPGSAPDAALEPGIPRWDTASALRGLPLWFRNSPTQVTAWGTTTLSPPAWTAQTLDQVTQAAGAFPSLELWRAGTYVSSHLVADLPAIATTPGPHELRATLPLRLSGIAGSTRVNVAFDTRRADPNPPFMSQLWIEQNGIRTATLSAPATLYADVTDDTALASVAAEWRRSGTSSWAPLPLTRAGSRYSAPLRVDGSVDVRLTIADAAGNSFVEEWSPAYVASFLGPVFEDDPLQPGVSAVRAVHINELRERIDTVRRRHALPAFPWTDHPVVAGATPVRAAHLADLRTALREAYTSAGRIPPAHAEPIVPGTVIKATHIAELRAAIGALW